MKNLFFKNYVILIILILILQSCFVKIDAQNNNVILKENIFKESLNETKLSEKNIIICSPNLFLAAKKLEKFHDDKGLPTKVVNTTWIALNYEMAPDPPFYGYPNNFITKFSITGYNYNLAKKIIKFLRDSSTHPNLEYVTLFGNGRNVPPSYYIFSQREELFVKIGNLKLPDWYNNRIATDFFYMSPDYDFSPEFKIGRLPANNVVEAKNLVEKIKNWDENADWNWFRNVCVAGDQPNLGEMIKKGCYAGEMIAIDSINNNYFNGMNITCLYHTDDKFSKSIVEELIERGTIGFFYIMTHGLINGWGINRDPLYTFDLSDIEKNNKTPIIVSVACMSGAYDTFLSSSIFNGLPIKGMKSLAEKILLSKGGGIAYIGTTRATFGSPEINLNRGELEITRERGIAAMLTNVFKSYHEGNNTLGDMTKSAIDSYVIAHSFSEHPENNESFIVLVSFVLLGDPALEIPHQIPGKSFSKPTITALNPEGYSFGDNSYIKPWYYIDTNITIQVETNSSQIFIKIIDIEKDQTFENKTVFTNNNIFNYTFLASKEGEYLVRIKTEDCKEGWLYLIVTKESP